MGGWARSSQAKKINYLLDIFPEIPILVLERIFMEYATKELERIANALEEILRLVKKDMEPKKK